METNKKARVIAFYLPQFHPIPENDKWWGKGFTEWTNVGKARPLFRGHYQPRVPADLGYYDLRMPEVREQQAELAREAGIEGFCYWHYWFGDGKRLLERPFNEVLASGKPDFPFCLGWANHSWTNKTWNVAKSFAQTSMLMEQKYGGIKDYTEHFYSVLPAFKDKRYIMVDNKPMFVIYSPLEFADIRNFLQLWQTLALKNGLNGIHFVGVGSTSTNFNIDEHFNKTPKIARVDEGNYCRQRIINLGFSAINAREDWRAELLAKGRLRKLGETFCRKYFKWNILDKYDYASIIKHLYSEIDSVEDVYPTLYPQFDRSPRGGKNAVIYHKSSPALFKKSIELLLPWIMHKPFEKRIVFVHSWNEWGEGAYIEPDIHFGHGFLNALKETICE